MAGTPSKRGSDKSVWAPLTPKGPVPTPKRVPKVPYPIAPKQNVLPGTPRPKKAAPPRRAPKR